MPIAVYILGLAIFAQGTSELMLAGLLPEMATDLGVSIPDAGLLISAFAVGMLVGAPVLAIVTLRWPRRTALLIFLAIFALAHVAGALTPNYEVLLMTRIVGAFVYAGFWAVAAVTAVDLVPRNSRAKAMSVVASGLTIATILGLPAGTLIGQHLGWRAAFWTVAALSTLAMAGVLATIPGGAPDPEATPNLREEIRAMANPRLWLSYATTALVTAAILVIFSYFAPLLTQATGLHPGAVPGVLALYGVGSLIGITIGGRTADATPFRTLSVGITGLVVLSAALALLGRRPRDRDRDGLPARWLRFRHQPRPERPGLQPGGSGTDLRHRDQLLVLQRRHHHRPLARRPGHRRRRRLPRPRLDRRRPGPGSPRHRRPRRSPPSPPVQPDPATSLTSSPRRAVLQSARTRLLVERGLPQLTGPLGSSWLGSKSDFRLKTYLFSSQVSAHRPTPTSISQPAIL